MATNMFQFLIGTIKTNRQYLGRGSSEPVSIPYRYDKNRKGKTLAVVEFMFQFLIGTIKTVCPNLPYCPGLLVSIPYRYDKNVPKAVNTSRPTTVSIPYMVR